MCAFIVDWFLYISFVIYKHASFLKAFGVFFILQQSHVHHMENHMRKAAEWTTQADERIMEFLLDAGEHPSSAIRHMMNNVCDGIEYSRPHISRRCKTLSEYGLLNKRYQNYELSEKGETFLNGDLDASSLEQTVDKTETENQ